MQAKAPEKLIIEPEGFIILSIATSDEEFYKIFSSWRSDDGWRLSSGSRDPSSDIYKEDGNIYWKQSSGSVYSLTGDEGGSTFYTQHQLQLIRENIKNAGGKSEIVKLQSLTTHLS